MISGKGILYTVLGATGAAIVAGTMLTKGNRSEKLRKFAMSVQNIIGSLGRKKPMASIQDSRNRAEFNQASRMGHA
jgi:hypothetical protein